MSYTEETYHMVKNYGGTPHPRLAIELAGPDPADHSEPLTVSNVNARTQAVIAAMPDYPTGQYHGRGVVICGGGRYFASAATLIYMLRQQRCHLPIELWYLGDAEMSAEMRALVEPYGVRCVDAYKVRETHPMRLLNGWESKCYAALHSSFEEVLFLDADNLPVVNPEFLFDSPEFRHHGAIFWPDIHRRPDESSLQPALWETLGNRSPLGTPEFESAQMFIHKAKCWQALLLAVWFNAHSDFFYQHMYGDKETFHLAWETTRTPYGMPSTPIEHHRDCLCQHDFNGRRLFQHRNGAKFELENNVPIQGFRLESQCLIFLARLARRWDGRICDVPRLDFLRYAPAELQSAVAGLVSGPHHYTRIGFDSRPLEFLRNGTVGEGAAFYEQFWALRQDEQGVVWLSLSSPVKPTCELLLHRDGTWRGRWEHSGEMAVELRPLSGGE